MTGEPTIQRSLRYRGFGIKVTIPRSFGRLLSAGRREPASPMLVVAPDVPRLDVARVDDAAERVVAKYRAALDRAPAPDVENGDLAARVRSIPWYHTIELPGGIVTPGYYDHRPLVGHYGLPADLGGKRVLDVGTWDGFWAFEMERRGADVVAADVPRLSEVDLPPQQRRALAGAGIDFETGRGFQTAHAARSSTVRRVLRAVYDLSSSDLGTFDLVHVGDVLMHLEQPTVALRRIRDVTEGTAIITDCFDPSLARYGAVTRYDGGWENVTTDGGWWWMPSLETLGQMVLDAGFRDVRVRTVYRLCPVGIPRGLWHAVLVATT